MWGVFTLYMWIPTFRTNFTVWSVFLLLWITFFLLAGLLTGLDALYASFAEVTNATFGRAVLPMGGPLLKG